ncbi:ergothioneine biosynthesis protein EgtB [Streptomyces radicis]|uniref:Hercynine oxygenase n=1 Tax=Streptomyces radicis TaxID=1750517 RepID=A0A3A9VUI4_9ACTN|nr:ergothioneine biosynthesis protein EgtB [Streptomyces radicis]RKN04172.1 ergothioneine biosynthesis protein EgtB [Streptomyces radicis]RKN14498.1 ergothioneine biosynthesis protein EgtB [Streptomyces radicis]
MSEHTLAPETTVIPVRERARIALSTARRRTQALTDCLPEPELTAQHSPLMSPLVWDMAHIGNQEELWLVRRAGGRPALRPDLDPLYDAFRHRRADRPALPLLRPSDARRYLAGVRDQALDVLASAPDPGDGFLFGMIAQHEQQHDETMLATHQLRRGAAVLNAPPPPRTAPATPLPREVLVPGGPFTMGATGDPWALDNERPAHPVDVQDFWLDTVPVTNAAYQEFIDDGGYDDPRWWQPDGWLHRKRADLAAPAFWRRDGSGWVRRRFGVTEPVPPDEPVLHVSWFEADAYARWAGRRLPTEAEWEKAARHDPATGRSRRYPWGDDAPDPAHANLGQRHLRPAPAGSYPAGAAPCGARQLLGDVWEWTATDFTGYPGFAAHPYREYSQVFFGALHKVLRGGSFGTDPVACRATFRNWDFPVRRQIFAGFRTCRGAEPG